MKIGFEAVRIFGASGIETYSRSLIAALGELEQIRRIKLFTTAKRLQNARELFGNSGKTEIRSNFLHPLAFGNAGAPIIQFLRDKVLLRRAAKEVDIFHLTDPNTVTKGINNLAVTIHDLVMFYDDEWSFQTFGDEKKKTADKITEAIDTAKVIFVPTFFVKNEILERFKNIDASKIFVTYEAASPQFRRVQKNSEIGAQYGIDINKKYLLSVSRIDPRKNFEKIIEAFAAVPKSLRNDTSIVFIGGGKKERLDELRFLASKFDIADYFIHKDNVSTEHLVHLYNNAEALIFPSFSEGFGLPIVEAFRCGCPVITSNISCMPEIAGDAALLVSPDSVYDISEKMTAILENDELKASLTEKGLERSKMFDWSLTAKDTLTGYLSVTQ